MEKSERCWKCGSQEDDHETEGQFCVTCSDCGNPVDDCACVDHAGVEAPYVF